MGCNFMNEKTERLIRDSRMHLYEEEKSENTIKKYTRDVRVFFEYLKNRELNKAEVLNYKKELCEKYMPRSVNGVLSSLNSLFVFMNRYDLKVKILKIQRQIFADNEKMLTKFEYEKLLYVAKRQKNKRLYYLIQLIASTGIRVSEVKYITVSALKEGRATINLKGKIRQIFLPKSLCIMLKKYAKHENIKSGAIFVTRNKNPLDRFYIWKLLKSLCKMAGVSPTKVFPHNLRHLFARTFYSMKNDIVRLADILGHSSVETTRIYIKESGMEHKKMIEKLGLLRC